MKLHFMGLVVLLLLSTFPAANVDAQQRQTQLRGPKDATDQFSGATYGPIDEQDTLWRIASRYRQNEQLSVYQVMQAIYELNPNAFEQNNFNLLVDGATLRLPSERYIARIDTSRAKQRADKDDKTFAQLLKNPQSGNNIKPAVPLVNKDELSDTRSQIEEKISALDAQQVEKFEALRDQFALSLDSVQSLLNENKKLYERVEQVNTDLMNLRQQVEGDVQSQMDEQLALQKELLDIVRQERAQREAEQSSSLMSALTQPASLIIGSGIITLLLAGALAAWLLKRRSDEPDTVATTENGNVQTAPEPDAEIDDLSTSLTSELAQDDAELSDDELFNDEELLDDVLSSELEDALDDELENFSDLDDDMLVPDSEDDEFESGESELDQDELDNLFDEEDLSAELLEENFDGIDLADDDSDVTDTVEEPETDEFAEPEPRDSFAEPVTEDDFTTTVEDSASDPAPVTDEQEVMGEAPMAPLPGAVDDADDKPEISIDDLLEEEQESVEDKLDVNNGNVDESMLNKLDKEINEQNEALDRLADDILNEIEQLEQMGGLPDVEDDEEDDEFSESGSTPSPQGIQSLDDLAEGLDDISLDEIETDEISSEVFDDDIIEKLQNEEEDSATSFDDPLSDELLAELSAEQGEEEQQLNDLSDELLAELESGMETEAETPPAPTNDEAPGSESEDLPEDALTEELLAELESEIEDEDGNAAGEDVSDHQVFNERNDEASSGADDDMSSEDGDELPSEVQVDDTVEDDAVADSTDADTDAPDSATSEDDVELPSEAQVDDTVEDDVVAESTETETEELTSPLLPEDDDELPSEAQVDDTVEDDAAADLTDADSDAPDSATPSEDDDELPSEVQVDDTAEDDAVAESTDADSDAPDSATSSEDDDELPLDVQADDTAEDDAAAESTDTDTDAPDSAAPSDDADELPSEAQVDDTAEDDVVVESTDADTDAPDSATPSEDDVELPSDVQVDDTAEDDAVAESTDADSDAPDSAAPSDDADKLPSDVQADDAVEDHAETNEPDALHSLDAESEDADPLDDALAEFDKTFIDDIPSFSDSATAVDATNDVTNEKSNFDDSVLEVDYEDDVEEFALEQEIDGVIRESGPKEINELEDVPGLDEWLTGSDKNDKTIFDDLDASEFDALLDEMDEPPAAQPSESTDDLKLDNPDLDLAALLNEPGTDSSSTERSREDEFLDVDTLLDESMQDDTQFEEMPLELDVSLSDYSGVSEDVDIIDIDKDAGQSANLDLARVYMEMDDLAAAKELLSEVVEKGSDEQQEEAQALLETLH
ncbi:AAA family ATPase [Salinimonas sp. HHU 13199]|uniref:AAA family ATPase n=1 Tax=Salinimonas profundi TaxID=2729140 RepID=A0ABR8LJP1_9ALTE|nr:FimV/HubP family polar landmark protein [Salinimonas profundi]MBD3584154.1 AAA family ATPase [Salinimonas profundi]